MKELPGDWIRKTVKTVTDPIVQEYMWKLVELQDKKLWHQLTVKIEEFISLPQLEGAASTPLLLELLTNFIQPLSRRFSPLRFVVISLRIAGRTSNSLEIVQQLCDEVAKLPNSEEAQVLAQCSYATLLLSVNKDTQCREILDQQEKKLKGILQPDSAVYASYYFGRAEYCKYRTEAAEFFNSGMKYLAYVPLEEIPIEKRRTLAFDLCLASLVGEKIYNFGELLSNPIIESLDNTPGAWLPEVVRAFNSGDISRYETLVQSHSAAMQSQPALTSKVDVLKEKIAVLALMELVFSRKADDRVVSFAQISNATRVPLNQVELLVIKGMSLELLSGSINQINQTVSFTRVQPRVIDQAQVEKMKLRLVEWKTKVHAVTTHLEQETPDLFK